MFFLSPRFHFLFELLIIAGSVLWLESISLNSPDLLSNLITLWFMVLTHWINLLNWSLFTKCRNCSILLNKHFSKTQSGGVSIKIACMVKNKGLILTWIEPDNSFVQISNPLHHVKPWTRLYWSIFYFKFFFFVQVFFSLFKWCYNRWKKIICDSRKKNCCLSKSISQLL